MCDISQEQINSIISYDPVTGFFHWLTRFSNSKSDNIFNSLYSGKIAGGFVSSKNSKTKYITIKIHGKAYKAHRLAFLIMTGVLPEEVDHIDHDGTNNKWSNLRGSNRKDNSKNLPKQKSNKTGVIGVNWHKNAKKWQARAVDQDGRRVDLGRYDDFDEAVRVRKEYEKRFSYYEYRSVENV